MENKEYVFVVDFQMLAHLAKLTREDQESGGPTGLSGNIYKKLANAHHGDRVLVDDPGTQMVIDVFAYNEKPKKDDAILSAFSAL